MRSLRRYPTYVKNSSRSRGPKDYGSTPSMYSIDQILTELKGSTKTLERILVREKK